LGGRPTVQIPEETSMKSRSKHRKRKIMAKIEEMRGYLQEKRTRIGCGQKKKGGGKSYWWVHNCTTDGLAGGTGIPKVVREIQEIKRRIKSVDKNKTLGYLTALGGQTETTGRV